MRNEIVLLCLVVMLMGNIGIVSAESNVLNFEHRTSTVAITETWAEESVFKPQGGVVFHDIANYPQISKIVISDLHRNKLKIDGQIGDYPVFQQLETSFILETRSGVQVGKGTYETYRFISDGVSTGSTEILYFDEWDIGTLSGYASLIFSYGDPEQIVWHNSITIVQNGGKYGVSSSPNEGYVWFRGQPSEYVFGQKVWVYSECDFGQDLYYNYDDDSGVIEITLERNNVWSKLTLLHNTTGEEIITSTGADDFYLMYVCYEQAMKVILENGMGAVWSNVIPSNIAYKPIQPPVIGSTIENIPIGSFDLNLTGYRYQIEKLPLLGNLSIPYLNFVDGVYSDVNGHIYDVVSLLMSPLYILNEKVVIISNLLGDQIKELISVLDIITGPMQSLVNVIPGKVMGFFVFFLLLDIVRVIIGWGM